jgi:NADH:ubiquinone reductase (H+-translocating)
MTTHTDIDTVNVVVIGGGYAGTSAANRLRARPGVKVTLVNPRPQFVERIRLHQYVAGTRDATLDYDTLLGDRVTLLVDRATRIDTDAREVHLASGRTLRYDYLIYAVGSTAATPAAVPGSAEFAYPIGEWEHAQRLRAAIDRAPADAPVTVVGGGSTGIETAAELADQGRKVTLVCGAQLAPTFLAPARRSVARWFGKHAVEVLEQARVAEVGPDSVVLSDGTVLPSAVTIWTCGFGVPELAAASGLRTDEAGRLLTDEALVSFDDDRIVAAGDSAAPSGRALRMSCQAAAPLGLHAADTVLALAAGVAPVNQNIGFVGAGVSLGRKAATVQFTRRDDTNKNMYLRGRWGVPIKELASKGAVMGIRNEARKPGSAYTTKGPGHRAAAIARESDRIARP